MNLGFMKKFSSGDPTNFVELINNGTKIHTVRLAQWRVGMKIHFATGVRTKQYNCFKIGVCTGIQKIVIKNRRNKYPVVIIDNRPLSVDEIETFMKNDGINLDVLKSYFGSSFSGFIIHWTNLRY
mgnify:CR=1 FL=1